MVAQPKFSNAHWGILIVDPERGDTLYSHNAGKLFMPASNQKIVTGSVALTLLGPTTSSTRCTPRAGRSKVACCGATLS
jgi:D-alanyl-D-alanine carboxypeptidase